MPKTQAERETLSHFINEYGPEKGKEYYYAKRNKSKKFDRSQGGGFSSKAQWWADRLASLPDVYKAEILENIKVDGPLHWWVQRMLSFKKADKGHGGFLVTDKDGKTHLPTKEHGKTSHRLLGAAWAALHGGYRGNKYEGPNKSQAISKLKKLYQSEGLETPSEK